MYFPHLTNKEIIDFIRAPYLEEAPPQEFKGYAKMLNVPLQWPGPDTDAPRGLTKKEYTLLLKENKSEIESLKKIIRKWKNEQKFTGFIDNHIEQLIEKEKSIKKRIVSVGIQFNNSKLEQAKSVPIENFIEIKHGFATCPLHTDHTPSMKIYKKDNRWHCFSCGKNGDTIDLVMALRSITLPEAIKQITT